MAGVEPASEGTSDRWQYCEIYAVNYCVVAWHFRGPRLASKCRV
ncbi:MAG: hypothetical protein U0894_03885 [Pirellulales bacterium]